MPEPKSLLITLCSIQDSNGRLLLLCRNNAPYRGYWGMPGGKVRFGEPIPDAAVREAKEETGLSVTFTRIAGVATETICTVSGNPDAHFVMFVVALHADVAAAPTATDEGELRWFHPDELDRDDVIPSDRDMLQRFVFTPSETSVCHYTVQYEGDQFTLLDCQSPPTT